MTVALANAAKLRGGYYTPDLVAQWLARWAVRTKTDRILEPSCGDGVFVAAADVELSRLGASSVKGNPQIVGVELQPEEAAKARLKSGRAQIFDADFFDWLDDSEKQVFDVVLGNPPFIRYQNFPEPSRTQAINFMQSRGLRPNRLTNIWVPFVVAGVSLLKQGGRLAMVVPAELLQVSYAAQLRQHLTDSFRQINLFACNEMFFDGAEQEVVLIAAEGKLASPSPRNTCRVDLIQTERVADLLQLPSKTRRIAKPKMVQHDSEKWLKYFLNVEEIEFMRELRASPEIAMLGECAQVDVGVVTGRNEFFVLSYDEVLQHELERFVIPLVGRSAHLSGALLNRGDLRELESTGKRVFLLHLSGHDDAHFTSGLRELIAKGEDLGHHLGYKCSIRKPWYQVPSVWEPDGFLFRQIYDFPRFVVNRANATSTDTIHRVKCKAPAARLAANFYTHLTAASAEIEGRSYGGGVLELEPTEAERLLVPKELNGAVPLPDVDKHIRNGRLSVVLEANDRLVLRKSLGLSVRECSLLKRIWEKMRNRRSARRRR